MQVSVAGIAAADVKAVMNGQSRNLNTGRDLRAPEGEHALLGVVSLASLEIQAPILAHA